MTNTATRVEYANYELQLTKITMRHIAKGARILLITQFLLIMLLKHKISDYLQSVNIKF